MKSSVSQMLIDKAFHQPANKANKANNTGDRRQYSTFEDIHPPTKSSPKGNYRGMKITLPKRSAKA
jgi:hypothetical protein